MGASAGPNLVGIGRGGDSNLVLEMDAHDAKSYPGEPTENLLSSSAMDFSVLSAYTGSTFTRVADGESPTGYACEMYYTGTVNTSARCLFGTNNGNMPTSGSAFVSVWVKRTAGPSTLMRPAYFAGNSWHVMPPLDGGSAYMTSEYRPFGYNGTVGTASGGPNPGFSMTNGGNSTSSDKTRWIMPQFTTKTYATPFVREGNGGTGTYNARPASVDLMIHGDVGTGQSFSDSSPSKHTVTADNSATHSNTESKFSGGSIYFNGATSDYIYVPYNVNICEFLGDFTIDFWANWGAHATTGMIMNHQGGSTNGWIIHDFADGYPRLYVQYSSGTWAVKTTTKLLNVDTWYHLACVRSGTNLLWFVDGVLEDTFAFRTGTMYPNASNRFQIFGNNVTVVKAYLDEVRITNGTALWTAAFTPPTRRNLSAPVVDRSGNYNGGNFATKETTDVATYRDGEVIKPVDSAVWDFDGTDDAINIATSSSIQLNTGSISFWVYFKAYDAGDLIQMAIGSGSYAQFYVRGINLSWNYYFQGGYYVNKNLTSGEQTSFFPLSTWLNVCWVFDKKSGSDAESSVYINGNEAFSLTAASSGSVPWGTAGMTIGGYTWDGFTETKIAQYAMYNKVLTAQQIKENFTQQSSRFNPPNWANRDIVQNGLKLWVDAGISESYPGSGTTWSDISGSGYSATMVASPPWTGGGDTGYFEFNGSTQYMSFGAIDLLAGLSSFTFGAWVWIDALTGGHHRIMSQEVNYYLGHYNAGMSTYLSNTSAGWPYNSVAMGSPPAGEWIYMVWRKDAATIYHYINAVSTGLTLTMAPAVGSNGNINFIGSYSTVPDQPWDGKIAAIHVYTRALSPSEIEQNFIVQKQRFGI